MADTSIPSLWRASLAQFDLYGAVIFVDDLSASALAWAVGLPALIDLGVLNVMRLGDVPCSVAMLSLPTLSGSTPKAAPTHAIVLCSTFLPEAYSSLRRSLCDHIRFERITIACSFSERAHATYDGVVPGSKGAYDTCRDVLASWLAEQRPEQACSQDVVSIVHAELPLHLCPLGSGLFLLPPIDAHPLLDPELIELQRPAAAPGAGGDAPSQRVDELLWSSLDTQRQRALGTCALGLTALLKNWRTNPALFALGPAGTLVARQVLQHLPAASSSAAANSSAGISVLVVDRSLDLVSPASHTGHPLDPLIAAPASVNDAASQRKIAKVASELPTPAGTVSHGGGHQQGGASDLAAVQLGAAEPACSALLDAILARRAKELPQLLLKTLATLATETDSDEPPELPPRPTPAALRKLSASLRAERRVYWENAPLLQAVELLIDATDAAASAVLQAELLSHQKLVQHTASEEPVAALAELIALARRAHNAGAGAAAGNGIGVHQLLPLVAMFYSLCGAGATSSDAFAEHEQRLRESLLQACLRDPGCGGLLRQDATPTAPELLGAQALMERRAVLDSSLRRAFERLHAIGRARLGMGASEALLLSSAHTAGEVYRPLLRYTLERAMRRDEMSELHHLSASIGSLFSRGASLLGVNRAAKLADARTILVFVVGGISLAEVRELRQLMAQHPKHRLLLGSTSITSVDTVWEALTRGLTLAAA